MKQQAERIEARGAGTRRRAGRRASSRVNSPTAPGLGEVRALRTSTSSQPAGAGDRARGASRAARGSRRPRSAAPQRLSQNAIEPGSQWNRHWYSGERTWSSRNGSSTSFSRSLSPTMCVVELRFTNSALRPVSGCVTDDPVLDRRALLLHRRRGRAWSARRGSPCCSGLVMSCTAAQPVDEVAHRRRQPVVRGVHAREAGVAADRRQLHRAEDRSHRRVGEERVVAVPLVGALALRVHLVEHDDLGRVLVRRSRAATRAAGRTAARTRAAASSVDGAGRGRTARGGRASAWRIAATSTSASGSRRSTPLISAPIAAVTGRISIVDMACLPGRRRAGPVIVSVPKNLRQ